MTDQEIFDQVVNHLRAQGAKALDDGECQYRAADGKKCAFGCLITDEEYNPAWEGKISDVIIQEFKSLSRFLPHLGLINSLQNIHDIYDHDCWEYQFEECAKEYNLIYKEPECEK